MFDLAKEEVGLTAFVARKFTNLYTKAKVDRYKTMGMTVDEQGDRGLYMRPKDYVKVQPDMPGAPSLAEWTEFLNNPFISSWLQNEAFNAKKFVIREMIMQITAKNNDPKQIKLLETLAKLVDDAESTEDNTIYVQYLTDYRYSDSDRVQALFDERVVDTTHISDAELLPDEVIKS